MLRKLFEDKLRWQKPEEKDEPPCLETEKY